MRAACNADQGSGSAGARARGLLRLGLCNLNIIRRKERRDAGGMNKDASSWEEAGRKEGRRLGGQTSRKMEGMFTLKMGGAQLLSIH